MTHFWRLSTSLPLTLFGVTLITFAIAQIIPSDVARMLAGDYASDAAIAELRSDLGLDRPVWEQYFLYLGRLSEGDLGTSLRSGRPIAEELLEVLPATFELALIAFVLIVIGGIALGSLAALSHQRWPDKVIRVVSTIAISAPTFWIGILLVWIFFGVLDWLPGNGRIDPQFDSAAKPTGLLIIDGIITGNLAMTGDAIRHLLLPACALALASTGAAARLVRATLLDVLQEDYVRRAEVAGLSRRRVLMSYALPNALIPFVTTAGIYLADLLAGAVVTEAIFGWPGIGTYTLQAISGLDFPAIMGFTLLAALVYWLANLLVDLIYLKLDPRIAQSQR